MASKYRNKPCYRGAIYFHSQKEARFYDELVLKQRAGLISHFHRQVIFDLPGGVKYVCDFIIIHPDGRIQYVDVKGMKTKDYSTKKKITEATYPVEIEER